VSEFPPSLLPTEYNAALERVQRIEERLLWIGGGGGVFALAAAFYVLINRAELDIGPAWAAPLAFIVTGAILLGLFAARLVALDHVQLLRRQAGMPIPPGSFQYPGLLRGLMFLPGIGLTVLYLLTLAYSLRAIYSVSRAAGSIFGVIYLFLSAALFIAGIAVWRLWRGLPHLTTGELKQVLLPFPSDLLQGMGLFFAGFLSPVITIGLNATQYEVLNALFRRAVNFTETVPWAAVAALGLSYFFVIEGLLVPAGRSWLALRRGEPGLNGYAQIVVRLLLAFPLAYALGGFPLLVLSLLIWLQQAALALNTVPNGPSLSRIRLAAHARFDLLWGGLLPALRFYGGVLVWVGSAWSFTFLLLLFCVVAFLGVAFRSAQHARQARLLGLRGGTPAEYDVKNAPRWQRASFLAAGFTAFCLFMLQSLAETNDFFFSYLAVGYGRFNNGAVQYSQAGLVNGLLLTVDLLVFGLLVSALYVRLLHHNGPTLSLVVEHVRAWLAPLLLAVGTAMGIAALVTGLFSLILGGLVIAILGAALWCER
jgi:hypothetical protein